MLCRLLPALFALVAVLVLVASSDARPLRGTIMARSLTPEERSWTNSKRLAYGLPPRAPNFIKRRPGEDPTPVKRWAHPSASASASPSPSASPRATTYTGRIQVKANLTSPGLGFVNNSAPGLSLDIKGKSGTDLFVKLTTVPMSKVPVSIIATNPAFPSPPWIGGATNTTLQTGLDSAVPLSNVPQTQAGQAPTSEGASAIWTLDARTHQLLPHWVNHDGVTVNTTIAYNPDKNSVFLVGDFDAYKATHDANVTAVQFYLSN